MSIRSFAWVSGLGRLTHVLEPQRRNGKTVAEEYPVYGFRLGRRVINSNYASGGGQVTITLEGQALRTLALSASGTEMRKLGELLLAEADQLEQEAREARRVA